MMKWFVAAVTCFVAGFVAGGIISSLGVRDGFILWAVGLITGASTMFCIDMLFGIGDER